MCRLLGIIANKPVDLEFSLKRFKNLDKEHTYSTGPSYLFLPPNLTGSEYYGRVAAIILGEV